MQNNFNIILKVQGNNFKVLSKNRTLERSSSSRMEQELNRQQVWIQRLLCLLSLKKKKKINNLKIQQAIYLSRFCGLCSAGEAVLQISPVASYLHLIICAVSWTSCIPVIFHLQGWPYCLYGLFVGTIMATITKGAHSLISRTCEYIILKAKQTATEYD